MSVKVEFKSFWAMSQTQETNQRFTIIHTLLNKVKSRINGPVLYQIINPQYI